MRNHNPYVRGAESWQGARNHNPNNPNNPNNVAPHLHGDRVAIAFVYVQEHRDDV